MLFSWYFFCFQFPKHAQPPWGSNNFEMPYTITGPNQWLHEVLWILRESQGRVGRQQWESVYIKSTFPDFTLFVLFFWCSWILVSCNLTCSDSFFLHILNRIKQQITGACSSQSIENRRTFSRSTRCFQRSRRNCIWLRNVLLDFSIFILVMVISSEFQMPKKLVAIFRLDSIIFIDPFQTS